MAKKQHDTPMLDQLESGPWPSFVTGLKRLAKDNDMMVDLMGQLETSYETTQGLLEGRHGRRVRLRRRRHPALHRTARTRTTSRCSPRRPSSTPCASSRRPACTTPPTCCARCATSG